MSEDLDKREQFIDRVLSILDKPYIKSLDNMGIDDIDTQELILSKLYNDNISIEYGDHYVDIYNSNGNLIYFENSDGKWDKWEFDSNGNEIYHENSDGFWEKWEYDSNGNLIYYEGSSGGWYKREYDSNNNLIYYEHSSGFWYKEEYDSNGDKIYYEDSDGYWDKYEYDSNGDLIYYENSNGDILDKRNNINESQDKKEQFINRVLSILELPYIKSLNSIGIDDEDTQKVILSKLFNDNVTIQYGINDISVYNSNGDKVYYEDSNGEWYKREYDLNGNQIYYEDSDGYWYKIEYDYNGKEIYYEDSDGEWSKTEYDSNGNDIYYENSDGDIIDRRNSINESEDKKEQFINKVLSILDTPYFKSLNSIGIDDIDTQKVILTRLFNDDIVIYYGDHYVDIYNSNGKEIYYEDNNGYWIKREYNTYGKRIYYENSNGEWAKWEYDSNGNEIYYENSNGLWSKREYNPNGYEIYYENSNGEWIKREYDSNGNEIYFENSNGLIIDKRNNINESEDKKEQFINRVLSILDTPYIKSLNSIGIDDIDTQKVILSKLYNDNISIEYGDNYVDIYNSNGNEIYSESSNDFWYKREFDSDGNQIYYEDSNGKIIDNRNNINESEDKKEQLINKVLSILELPYIKSLNSIGIDDIDTQKVILSRLFNDDVIIKYYDYEINIYNSNGNEIYSENSNGDWVKYEYDSKGRIVYHESSSGFWMKKEFNSKGNEIYYENSNGYWYKYEYDSNGKEIYYEDNNGKIIDKRNNINESEDKRDVFIERVLSILDTPYFMSLDSIGIDDEDIQKLIFSRLFNDNVTIEYGDHYVDIYNSNGKVIYYEDSRGKWVKTEYDSQGNKIYYENYKGEWSKAEYDSDGNEIYYENSDGDWYKYEYDSQGNKIYYENSYGKIIDRRNKPEI